MKIIVAVLLTLTLLHAQYAEEKLVLAAGVTEKLATVKNDVADDPYLAGLITKHKLVLQVESFKGYPMLVLKPIRSAALKEELALLLTPRFPDMIFIQNTQPTLSSLHQRARTAQEADREQKISTFQTMLFWLLFSVIALLGIIAVSKGLYELYKIKISQRLLLSHQEQATRELKTKRE